MNVLHAAMPMAIGVSGNTVGNWLIDNVIFVMVVVAAITIASAAITKKPRDAMITFAITMLALLLISLAAFRTEIGDWIRTTFLGG